MARPAHSTRPHGRQHGLSLIIVMMILVVASILGISAVQISMMAERGARNDRDTQMSWQSAEAGLVDAEYDLRQSPTASKTRSSLFGANATGEVDINNFIVGCGTSGSQKGLCALPTSDSDKPAWLTVDFDGTGSTTEFGTWTGRTFAAGSGGPQPAQPPRYIIEAIKDQGQGSRDRSATSPGYVFRVTSMGFGPRNDIQAVVQMIFRN